MLRGAHTLVQPMNTNSNTKQSSMLHLGCQAVCKTEQNVECSLYYPFPTFLFVQVSEDSLAKP